MEDQIQFVANYEDWRAVKKITITEKTEPKKIMEFLAGLLGSADNKIEENLGKIVDLEKLDNAIRECELGKGDAGKAIEEVSKRKIGSVIKEITSLEGYQKNEIKELQDFCRVYAIRKALRECDIKVEYSEVEIPGMKRLMKKKL